MKDAFEVLYQKEADLVRVRQEVESLRVVASLLTDDGNDDQQDLARDLEPRKPAEPAFTGHIETAATGTDGPITSSRQPSFWEFLKPARR
jgi:hypothetical protein